MLVCGQGRVEAFQALGETEIPAQVIAASDEEAFVMSLVENIARRQTPATEQIETIRNLRQRGYDVATIARKTAQDLTWVRGILTLLDQGEDRLIMAVESGRVPLHVAVKIASSADGQIQEVLQASYESGQHRPRDAGRQSRGGHRPRAGCPERCGQKAPRATQPQRIAQSTKGTTAATKAKGGKPIQAEGLNDAARSRRRRRLLRASGRGAT